MNTFLRSFLLLSIILLPIVSPAQNSSAISNAEVTEQIFNEIPLEERLREAPQQMQALISQNPFGLPPSQNEKMINAFEEAFTNNSLIDYAHRAFLGSYKPEPAQATLQWFQNEDTQLVLEAEKEFYTIEGIRQRVVNKYELEQNPPPQDRIELITSLSEEMSAVETEIESRVIIFRALISAFSELNTQQSLSEVQIEGAVNNYRNQVRSQIDQEVTNQLLTLYYGLNNNTLQKQISFYQSDAGTWLTNAISTSLHSAYQKAANKFLDAIKDS